MPRNRPALIAVLLGVVIVTLDISLTNTALPAIARGLDVGPATTIWIINVYYLAVIAALLPLGALGEIIGHRKIVLGGLAAFAVGALVSGLAPSLPALMAGRALLGIGSAAVSATTPAMIRTIYPATHLGRGFALYAMVVGISFTVGPTATSAVLAVADWRWLFLLGAPVALAALGLGYRSLPETSRNVRRFDTVSALLCAAMFASLLFAIAGMAHLGSGAALAAFGVSAICAAVLSWHERGRAAPILAMDLFRVPVFTLSAVTSVCSFGVQGLVFVALPILFQYRMGFTQVETGLLIMPWPAALAAMTLLTSRLTDRVAPGLLGGIGLLILVAGLSLLATLPADAGVPAIAWRLVLCGIGFGFFQSPNMVAIMRSSPAERSGSAGGILALSRLLGQAIGAAIVAFCLSRWPETGVGAAIWTGTVLALAGAAASLLRLLPSTRSGK